jgi:hypothetical protein
MADDDWKWIGVGAAGAGIGGLVALGAWRFHEESYKKGWSGEELALVHLFGITGETHDGTWVLMSSFNRGRYDRELQLRLQIAESKVEDLQMRVSRIEVEIRKLMDTAVAPEEKEFLSDLLAMLKIRKGTGSSSQQYYTV